VKSKDKSARSSFVELVVIVAVALGLALLIQAFLVKPYRIPSGSMLPTLDLNQRVLVNRIGNNFSDPEVGEILVFHPPEGSKTDRCGTQVPEGRLCPKPFGGKREINFIKRVVGVPGDKIRVQDGRVIRNGKPTKEPFIQPCPPGADCNFAGEITVPKNSYFMMGDNRGESDDSRFWGPVPRDWVIGGAFATYWPPKKIGLL